MSFVFCVFWYSCSSSLTSSPSSSMCEYYTDLLPWERDSRAKAATSPSKCSCQERWGSLIGTLEASEQEVWLREFAPDIIEYFCVLLNGGFYEGLLDLKTDLIEYFEIHH